MMEKSNQPSGRQKKSRDEKKVLEASYMENSQWNYDKKTELAIQLNMTFA